MNKKGLQAQFNQPVVTGNLSLAAFLLLSYQPLDNHTGIQRMSEVRSLTLAGWLRVLGHPAVILTWLLELAALYVDLNDPGRSVAAMFRTVSNLSEWMEPIAHLAGGTSFSENAKVFLFVVFVTYPLLGPLIAVRAIGQDKDYLIARWRNDRRSAYIAIVALPLLLTGLLAGAILSNSDPGFCSGCSTDSRFGMFLLYGVLLPSASAYLLGATLLMSCNIRKIFANQRQ